MFVVGLLLNEFEIEWRECGEGDAVLFVHGFPFNSAMWGYQLGAMPPGWRGIAPDLRGFGSSEPGDGDIYAMETMADDIAALMDRLEIERAVICGLSMGGSIALEVWRRHIERVRALVLSGTRAGTDSRDMKKARRALARQARDEGPGVVAESLLPRLLSPATAHKQPGIVAMVRALMEETPAETMARALLGMAERANCEPVLHTIDVPVLIVLGEDDRITGRGQAEMLARGIRGARLEVIAGAGHLPNLEQAAEFNAILEQFLDGLPRDTLSTRGIAATANG